ncbi:hypothetical protein [Streptomyces albireticuli]|uniref:hypothetical protein n=1 Tax=Streptomyces albireticuli TaxID=1940 RepID=UPI001476607B|nr:hypothetical protein [Streptomyces albireticuli]MCD9194245.1 hypothetical protein [Streptomyces albireticuli]
MNVAAWFWAFVAVGVVYLAASEAHGQTHLHRNTVRGGLTPRERARLDKHQKEAA